MARLYFVLWFISSYLAAQNTYTYQPIAPVISNNVNITVYNDVDLSPEKEAME